MSVFDQYKKGVVAAPAVGVAGEFEKKKSQPVTTSGVYAKFKGTTQPVESPYFAAVDKQGNSFGFSDTEKDTSGRAFFAFRKPGDTSTTTDKTRVATKFDPRVAAPQTRESFTNPRAEGLREKFKKEMGIAYTDELDHKIALALSGSNAPENLRPIPASENDDSAIISNLAMDVIEGRDSLFDAQTKLAKAKGIEIPFTGKKPGFLSAAKDLLLNAGTEIKNKVEGAAKSVKDFLAPEAGAASVYDQFQSSRPYRPPEHPTFDTTTPLPSTTNAQSTQAVPTDKTVSTVDMLKYAFDPHAEVSAPNYLFSTEAERKDATLTGPRIISEPSKFIYNLTSAFITAVAQLGVDLTSAAKIAVGKSGNVTLPINPERLGFDKTDVLNGKTVKDISSSALDRTAELDQERPNTKNLNLLQAFGEKVFTRAIINPIVTGDVLKSASQTMLAWSKSSPQLGLSSSEIKNLAPQDAFKEVTTRFSDRVNQIIKANTAADGTLSTYGKGQISELTKEVQALGQAFSSDTIPQLNPIGQFFDQMSLRLNQDVLNLGKPLGLSVAKVNPADETLPGYKPQYTAQPAGLSVQPVEPVGFGAKPAGQNVPVYRYEGGEKGAAWQRVKDVTGPDAAAFGKNGISVSLDPESSKMFGDTLKSSKMTNPKFYDLSKLGDRINAVKDVNYRAFLKETAGEPGADFVEYMAQKGYDGVKYLADDGKSIWVDLKAGLNPFQAPTEVAKQAAGIVAKTVATNEFPITASAVAKQVISSGPKTQFASGPIRPVTLEEKPVVEKIKALTMGAAKTEVIAHTPGFVSADGKERPLLLSQEIVKKIQGDHGPIVPENLAINANNWDFAIKNVDKNPDKINLIKKIPNSENFLTIGANRDNGFYTVTQYETLAKTSDKLKRLLQNKRDALDSGGAAVPSFATSPEGVASQPGLSGVRVNTSILPNPEVPVKSIPPEKTSFKNYIFSRISGPKIPVEEAKRLIFQDIPKNEVRLMFSDELLNGGHAVGSYESFGHGLNAKLKPLIKLYQEGGKVGALDVFHESGHYIFENFLSPAERQVALDLARKNISFFDKIKYKLSGYKGSDAVLEEYIMDKYAEQKAAAHGFRGPLKSLFEKIDAILKKISATYKKVVDRIKKIAKEKGTQGGYANFTGGEEAPKKIPKELINPQFEKKIAELKTELSIMDEALAQNPAKRLAKYANRNGELPEVIGNVPSKFGRSGDDIVTTLGFKDSEEARLAYANYKLQLRRRQTLASDITKIKASAEQAKFEDKDAKSLASLLEKTSKLSDSDISSVVNSSKKPQGRQSVFQEVLQKSAQARREYLDRLLSETYKYKPEVQREQLSETLKSLDQSQPVTLQEHERLNAEMPYNKIIIDTSTPVKEKVGILDYVRTPDRVLEKIGLARFNAPIRHAYESYLSELPQHMELIKHWERRAPATGASKRIFQFLDGQSNRDFYSGKTLTKQLSKDELQVAEEIKTYLKDWAERLNLPEDNRVSHYITHVFDIGEIEKEFDEDLAKLIKDKVPGAVYDPFLEKRLGRKGYVEDTWKALEAYSKRAVRKANMDPVLERLKDVASRLEDSQATYIKKMADKINLRPSEIETLADNTIKQIIGYRLGQRPVAYLTRGARQMVYRAMLGLNVSSAVKNLTQGVNTFAKLGPKYTMKGYYQLITRGANELEEVGVLNQDMIQDRTLTATKKMVEKLDKALFIFFEMAEKINRGAAYYGAKAKAMDLGFSEVEAVTYAKKVVRDTQFNFGSIDTPVGLNNDLAKVFTQFMSFGVKQTEFAAEMVKNKEWGAIMRYIAASVVVVYTLGKIFNLKIQDFIPGYSFTKFGTPPALALPWEIIKAITNSPDQFGNPQDWLQKGVNIASAIPYPAKIQTEKTIKGLSTFFDKTKDIKQSIPTFIKAGILGPKNLAPAHPELQQAKADESAGRKQATVDAQAEYARIKASSDPRGEWEKLNASNPTLAKKVADLAQTTKLNLNTRDKGLLFLGVTNGRRAQAIFDLLATLTTPEEKRALWDELTQKKVITATVNTQLLNLLNKK